MKTRNELIAELISQRARLLRSQIQRFDHYCAADEEARNWATRQTARLRAELAVLLGEELIP